METRGVTWFAVVYRVRDTPGDAPTGGGRPPQLRHSDDRTGELLPSACSPIARRP